MQLRFALLVIMLASFTFYVKSSEEFEIEVQTGHKFPKTQNGCKIKDIGYLKVKIIWTQIIGSLAFYECENSFFQNRRGIRMQSSMTIWNWMFLRAMNWLFEKRKDELALSNENIEKLKYFIAKIDFGISIGDIMEITQDSERVKVMMNGALVKPSPKYDTVEVGLGKKLFVAFHREYVPTKQDIK